MKVRFLPSASRHLVRLEAWLEQVADAETARRFVGQIAAEAYSLSSFPYRGSPRHDLPRPGLRSISFRRNVTIVYRVANETVVIIAVRYAGQDWPGLLQDR